MDEATRKLNLQFAYLSKIRNISLAKLRKLHLEVFKVGTIYYTDPYKLDRDLIIKRLFYYFCLYNTHLNEKQFPIFRKKAIQVLSAVPNTDVLKEQAKIEELKNTGYFTEEKIMNTIPINEIDGYLSILGLFIDAKEGIRRKLFKDFIFDPNAVEIRNLGSKSWIKNRFLLIDIIAANPTMTYGEFRKKYADNMPTVTRRSFNNTRSKLKKEGIISTKLRPGRQSPIIKKAVGYDN